MFAHQDQALSSRDQPPRVLARYEEMSAALRAVVKSAEEYPAVTGSRSRDVPYLAEIEDLASRPRLVHYRVLFGHPHHGVLKEHLHRLLEIRDPAHGRRVRDRPCRRQPGSHTWARWLALP